MQIDTLSCAYAWLNTKPGAAAALITLVQFNNLSTEIPEGTV